MWLPLRVGGPVDLAGLEDAWASSSTSIEDHPMCEREIEGSRLKSARSLSHEFVDRIHLVDLGSPILISSHRTEAWWRRARGNAAMEDLKEQVATLMQSLTDTIKESIRFAAFDKTPPGDEDSDVDEDSDDQVSDIEEEMDEFVRMVSILKRKHRKLKKQKAQLKACEDRSRSSRA